MLYSQGKANGTSEKESWVGPKAGLDAVEKWNIFGPCWELKQFLACAVTVDNW
jgi:hypothetical protein